MREKIFNIIEARASDSTISRIYDFFMMATILISLLPLTVKVNSTWATTIDFITVVIFIIDYVLRLMTADYKLNKGKKSFIQYPFTFMALVDLISILPSITLLNGGLKVLRIFRLMRTFRVFRVFKGFRYSKSIRIVISVFKKQKDTLLVVCSFAVAYIIVCALIIFNVEPDTFNTFFDAIYWSTVTLTTVGFGDIFAVSVAGRIITMISSVVGIAIVALPAGIITAGYMEEINSEHNS